jgi:hypothetical protein
VDREITSWCSKRVAGDSNSCLRNSTWQKVNLEAAVRLHRKRARQGAAGNESGEESSPEDKNDQQQYRI